ncbi:hypothetical protein GCM10017710_09570 [Arthrobacter ramosus]
MGMVELQPGLEVEWQDEGRSRPGLQVGDKQPKASGYRVLTWAQSALTSDDKAILHEPPARFRLQR